MVFDVPNAVCPKCGCKGLYITQEDWKPVKIKCRRKFRCGWEVDLRQFWPKKDEDFLQKGSDEEDQHKPDETSEDLIIGDD
jgi:hypothetical protein